MIKRAVHCYVQWHWISMPAAQDPITKEMVTPPVFQAGRSKALGTSLLVIFYAPIGVMRPRRIDNGPNLSPTRPMCFFCFLGRPSVNWIGNQ